MRIIDGIDGTLNRLASKLGGRLKLASDEDLLSRVAKFNVDGDVKFDTNSSAQVGKFDAKGRSASSEQGSGGCGESGKIYYPNGNSVEYFYSKRALDAAQLERIEIFLKRLEKMREIN